MAMDYIGSKISVISKSDIRYEGILVSINMEDTNITLSSVRSFGDEGRRPHHPVAPQSQTYETIVFKADDIKELNVLTQPAASDLMQDPAIVSATGAGMPPPPSYGPYGSYQAPPPPQQSAPAYGGAWGAPPPQPAYTPLYGSSAWGPPPPSQPQAPPPAPQQQQQPAPPAQAPAPPAAPATRAPTIMSGAPQPGGPGAVAPTVSVAARQQQQAPKHDGAAEQQQHQPPAKPATWAQAAGGRNAGGRGPAMNGGAAAAAGRGRGGAPPPGPSPGRGAAAAGGAGGGVPAGPPGQPRPTPGAAPAPVPKEDFDFEAYNAKFNKEAIAKEAEKEAAKEPVYKKDDFFDQLTVDGIGGGGFGGNADWRAKMMEQKKLDIETFGGLGGVRHIGFGRGRGGGRGGPGGPVGGGGGRGGPHVPVAAGGRGGGRGDGYHGGRGGAGGGGGRGYGGSSSNYRGGFAGGGRGGGRAAGGGGGRGGDRH